MSGFGSIGSRKYAERQNLALQATTEQQAVDEVVGTATEPVVDRPQYKPTTKILSGRQEHRKAMIVLSAPAKELNTAQGTSGEESAGFRPEEESHTNTIDLQGETESDREQPRSTEQRGTLAEPEGETDDEMDERYIFREDIENKMAVLAEVEATTKEMHQLDQGNSLDNTHPVTSVLRSVETTHICKFEKLASIFHCGIASLDDIRVEDPHATQEKCERLRRMIGKRCHLLIGAINALPPASHGAICDIDVETAKPGLLSAKLIINSTSPWASPIVVIIKANRADIRPCTDYQVMKSLTRLMVYPMPLINDLLEDIDKALWYCSLDMASSFWMVSMTPRARLVSAFMTPFGMPFGILMRNAPQIYQRIVDNALYGHMRIKPDQDISDPVDVFKEGAGA
ncbi:reverse transcriptase [Phytophthora megakarya]|uniref:Reverse transcriptase n=1 Tax=Phytophthora megakarya TaxID=4795 RepID=A0A225VWR4_9STRA|nr:reverse transcriptase [Phytophthora megakarya]